ncbi:MAG: glycosyltransferase family 4 protein, partial [Candidatus Peribacteraceae bacterium]|nr:glycosyltransferase family 4 protein [Candidatus Peribacteraceae bacterium]
NRSFLKGFIVRSPDVVTVISQSLADTVKSLGRKDLTLIPNGINLKALNTARDNNQKIQGRVLFVGRLEMQKGVDVLLKAFAKLPPGAHLRIVGDGSKRCELVDLATDLGITDRVEFVGSVSADQIADEYAQAEIFCGLSRSEALGNVFLEAQAAGCAVIGTNVGGIPDTITDEKTGLLIDPDNASDATIAIGKLLADQNLRQTLSQAGSANAQNYGWDIIGSKYAKLY